MDSGGGPAAPGAPEEHEVDPVRALAERYRLAPGASQKLSIYLDLMVRDDTAPTAIRDPQRVLGDHLADSLVALEIDQVRSATDAADLGAGAGLPGLPLAIARPESRMTLLESSRRKCDFIERAVAACGVANASVICERAESWRTGLGRMDLVTARAVGPLPVVVEYAAPLLRAGGALVVWRGKREPEVEHAAAQAAEHLAMELLEVRAVHPYPEARHRHLYLWLKVGETPAGFPRRPGVALKRPLGSHRNRRAVDAPPVRKHGRARRAV
jgi:16S rRNA (guanine527-N7)-methyltransferase